MCYDVASGRRSIARYDEPEGDAIVRKDHNRYGQEEAKSRDLGSLALRVVNNGVSHVAIIDSFSFYFELYCQTIDFIA